MANGSDNDEDRLLPPTERRLQRAREEGHVPRSRSLTSTLMLAASAAALAFIGPDSFTAATRMFAAALHFGHAEAFNLDLVARQTQRFVLDGLLIAMPLCLASMAAAVVAPLVVGGWVFRTESLMPDFSRLSPMRGLGNIFSVTALADLGKVLLEAILLIAVVIGFMYGRFSELVSLSAFAGSEGQIHMGSLVTSAFFFIVLALSVGALIDVFIAIWRHRRALRMSLQDIRQEARESEGDPQVKAKIRNQQRQMARRRMMQEVPKADVVVTNPTHYAVALRYDERRNAAPRVVAKGSGQVAQRIRALAADANVPLIEAPALARSLNRHCELGEEVPQALYSAVAQVLAYLFSLRAASRSFPRTPLTGIEVSVPPGFDPMEAVA